MRWILLFGIFLAGVGLSIYAFRTLSRPQTIRAPQNKTVSIQPTQAAQPATASVMQQAVFVPYWQLANGDISFPDFNYLGSGEKRFIYFGVAVDKNGVQKSEQGYTNISLFLDKAGSAKKYLGVRMTDDTSNTSLLADSNAQSTIVTDVVTLAKQKGFDGIVVDLELKPTLNDKIPTQSNAFISAFIKQAHDQGMKLAITIYGDNFYRKRPYDISYLAKTADEFMIMAYDLHKASGEPGPNFPLEGRDTFGYDMKSLISDFGGVPTEKITVIFGLYGYDWVVDETKRPIRPAKSVTLAQIKADYLDRCAVLNCVTQRDKMARENEIDFVDKQLLYHVIWYEDMESSREKVKFLNSKGIGSVAFWAAGFY